jgi:hypothetical protein
MSEPNRTGSVKELQVASTDPDPVRSPVDEEEGGASDRRIAGAARGARDGGEPAAFKSRQIRS